MSGIPVYPTEVIATGEVTPWMRRIVVGGSSLVGFGWRDLPDERVKLFLPREDGERPPLPRIGERGEYEFPAGVARPTARTFTVRRFDPERTELTIDIAAHAGPAADWAERARPGERIGIAGPSGGWEPSTGPGHHLLIGDEAALPGIATILERLPAAARCEALIEVADPGARQPLESRADLDLRWLDREGAPSETLRRAVVAYPWRSDSPPQLWAAGESLAMREVRRFVRDELRLPRERFLVVGYWRQGLDEDAAIDAHVSATEAVRARGGSVAEIENAGIY